MISILKVYTLVGIFVGVCYRSEAATTAWQFEVTLTSARPEGSLTVGQTFPGKLTYPSTTIPLVAAPELQLDFFFANNPFDQTADKATGYPLFNLEEEPALTFCVDLEPAGFDAGAFFHIYPDNTFQYSLDGTSEYEGLVSFSQIPEPATFALLLAGCGILLPRRR